METSVASSGARIETFVYLQESSMSFVASSRGRGLKQEVATRRPHVANVASSRGRGLKLDSHELTVFASGRLLTGRGTTDGESTFIGSPSVCDFLWPRPFVDEAHSLFERHHLVIGVTEILEQGAEIMKSGGLVRSTARLRSSRTHTSSSGRMRERRGSHRSPSR